MLLESNGKSFQRKKYKNKNKPLKNRWKNTIKIMKHGKRNTILKTHLTKRANLKINMMIKNKPKEKNQKVIERKWVQVKKRRNKKKTRKIKVKVKVRAKVKEKERNDYSNKIVKKLNKYII
jgi:hypothetical protein